MNAVESVVCLRVRYSETDQMGTFYNSRALDWFECGRTELMRQLGVPYSSMETKGVFLPVIEAHIEYLGRAQYDDLLQVTTRAVFQGRARLRCDVRIVHATNSAGVVQGYTIHAFTSREGKPIRPPAWFLDAVASPASQTPP
jgi:acyl-CoA thioester hydrolase